MYSEKLQVESGFTMWGQPIRGLGRGGGQTLMSNVSGPGQGLPADQSGTIASDQIRWVTILFNVEYGVCGCICIGIQTVDL